MEEDPEGRSRNDHFRPFCTSYPDFTTENDPPSKPREDLKEFSILPPEIGREFNPNRFANRPLQDLDPFYSGTFVTITKSQRIYRFDATNVLWMFGPQSTVRIGAIRILTNPLFCPAIVLTVLANIYFLATPNQNHSGGRVSEIIFVTIYSFEFLVKLIARGFVFGKFAYAKDGWSILDLIILVLAYFGLITGMNVTFGGLRALKLIPNIFAMRHVFNYFTNIFKNLFYVGILTIFALSIYTIVGSSMFMNLLSSKCTKNFFKFNNDFKMDFKTWASNSTNWFPPSNPYTCKGDTAHTNCPEDERYYLVNFELCNSITKLCPKDYECYSGYGPNQDFGYTSFDNFFFSFLNSIRMLKLDFWEALYFQTSHIFYMTPGLLYFGLVMFTGSFYLLALIFGVTGKTVLESLEKRRILQSGQSRSIWKRVPVLNGWVPLGIREFAKTVIFHPSIAIFMKVVIILHTIMMFELSRTLKMEDNEELETLLKIAVIIFNCIYVAEFAVKMMAVKNYFDDGWRRFEFLIVVGVFIDFIAQLCGDESNFVWYFRLLIVLRLAQHWTDYERLLSLIKASITKELGAFLLIIQIFIVCSALIGLEWFGRHYENHEEIQTRFRWNFVDFRHSFMIVFRALCGEWIESMWDCIYFAGNGCIPFFLVVVFIGNFLTLTFFVLLYHRVTTATSGDDDDDDDDEEILENSPNPFGTVMTSVKSRFGIIRKPSNLTILSNGSADVDQDQDGDEILSGGVKIASQSSPSSGVSQFIENKWFKVFMVIFIIATSIALCFEDIHHQKSAESIFIIDIIFALVIFIEMVLKIKGLGPITYFTSGWCLLDLAVLIVSIFELFQPLTSPGPFRAFRVLMIISRIPSLKEIANRILEIMRNLFGMISACACYWLVFALLGVALLHGRFHKCVDPESGDRPDYRLIQGKHDCLGNNMTWENSKMNFDHIGNAYLSLFMVSSFKGWIGVMNNAIDSRGLHEQHQNENAFVMYLYFVVFIVFGVFLPLGVLVGEAVTHLGKMKREKITLFMDRCELYCDAAFKLRKVGNNATRRKQIAPQPRVKCMAGLYSCFTGKTLRTVDATVMTVFLVVTATQTTKMSDFMLDMYSIFRFAVFLFIWLPVPLKILVLRRHFFSEPSNLLDFLVFIICPWYMSIELVTFDDLNMEHWTFRLAHPLIILRAARVVLSFMAEHLRGIQTLLLIMMSSLLEVLKCSLLLLILIFSYALFGMLQFKNVKFMGPLDDHYNFQTFLQSVEVMFVITTGAGWDGILDAISNEEDCDPNLNCGNAVIAIPFLVSFLVLCFPVIAYMFLVVIQEYFSEVAKAKLDLKVENVQNFEDVWSRFDPESTGYIEIDQLAELLNSLETPLQVKMMENQNESVLNALGVPLFQGNVVAKDDVFEAVVKRHFTNLNI